MIVVCPFQAPYGTTIILRKTLESYNYIDVYIILVTQEALFQSFQFTTKCCQNATMYKKIIIFLNQMILSSIDINCMHQRLATLIN